MTGPLPTTPREAWVDMQSGNERFISGTPAHPRQDVEHRADLAGGQTPHAALFGCSDSRLSAEIIFDCGLGDLFVVRNAGQTISNSVIGSLEYAVATLGVHLIVVLAHDSCGAVQAAMQSRTDDEMQIPVNVRGIINTIQPAIDRVLLANGTSNVRDINIDDVGEEHLRDTIAELLATSELITEGIASGTLAVVGATYNLRDGRVSASVVIGDIN